MKLRPFAARQLLSGLLVALAAAPAIAQSRIAILDATGISVLDTTTGQSRARFRLPLLPDESPVHIAASADGARLLVTASVGVSQAPQTGVLYVIDAVTGEVMARVPGRASNGKPAVRPDGARAFMVSVDPAEWFRASNITTWVPATTGITP